VKPSELSILHEILGKLHRFIIRFSEIQEKTSEWATLAHSKLVTTIVYLRLETNEDLGSFQIVKFQIKHVTTRACYI
jgi:hypothetical protein